MHPHSRDVTLKLTFTLTCKVGVCISTDCKEATQGDQYVQESAGTDETTAPPETHSINAAVSDSTSAGLARHRR